LACRRGGRAAATTRLRFRSRGRTLPARGRGAAICVDVPARAGTNRIEATPALHSAERLYPSVLDDIAFISPLSDEALNQNSSATVPEPPHIVSITSLRAAPGACLNRR